MKKERDLLPDAVHLLLLCGLAIAQPIYDVLARGATFFVAHGSEPIDILALVVILSLLIPIGLVALEWLARRVSQRLRESVHVVVVGGLVVLFVLPIVKRLFATAALVMTVALLLGAIAAWSDHRFRPLRSPFSLCVLALAALAFPLYFVVGTPVAQVVAPEKVKAADVEVAASPPVVMVVFDEFSSTSLLDEDRQIDAVRYPNFAALSRDGTWYRNASSVSDWTSLSVPAILTGKYPLNRRPQTDIPTAASYPDNLFTLLGNSYRLHVWESITDLCPEDLCVDSTARLGLLARMTSVLSDLHVLFQHVVLPTDWTTHLADVTTNWKDFSDRKTARPSAEQHLRNVQERSRRLRQEVFHGFLNTIESSGEGNLHFLHTLLPHFPYAFMPSGKHYGLDIGVSRDERRTWAEEQSALQSHQRYLLQLQYVDSLIGELVDRLESAGIYDSSLIVITADHGVSFRPGDARRVVTDSNHPDLLLVPLFIKKPFQEAGGVDDRSIEGIDVLPTIADALGVAVPWAVDGLRVDDPRVLERQEKSFLSGRHKRKLLSYGIDFTDEELGLGERLSLFGSGAREKIFRAGPQPELIGRELGGLSIVPGRTFWFELECPSCYDDVDPESPVVFTHVTGTVGGGAEAGAIAVAVNGTVWSVTEAQARGSEWRFSAVVPERSLQAGKNEIRLFAVEEAEGEIALYEADHARQGAYTLALGRDLHGDVLSSPQQETIPVLWDGSIRGHLGVARPRPTAIHFAGWAADSGNQAPVEAVVIFEGGRQVASGRTYLERPSRPVGSHLRWSGFEIAVPRVLFSDPNPSNVRVFAVSKEGAAAELTYPAGYELGVRYVLAKDPKTGAESLATSGGATLAIVPEAFAGSVEAPERSRRQIQLAGWAADLDHEEIPETIAVFADGELVLASVCNAPGADAVRKNAKLRRSGFRFSMDWEHIEDPENAALRVFAISRRGYATELSVPPAEPARGL